MQYGLANTVRTRGLGIHWKAHDLAKLFLTSKQVGVRNNILQQCFNVMFSILCRIFKRYFKVISKSIMSYVLGKLFFCGSGWLWEKSGGIWIFLVWLRKVTKQFHLQQRCGTLHLKLISGLLVTSWIFSIENGRLGETSLNCLFTFSKRCSYCCLQLVSFLRCAQTLWRSK